MPTMPTMRVRHPNERMPDLRRRPFGVRPPRDWCADAIPSGTGRSHTGAPAAESDYALQPAFGDPGPNPNPSRAMRIP